MSGVHKNPTISFRVSDREREQIEAKIIASGMSKKDYFIRSCIYNRICVVGKKELIYRLVQELQLMQTFLQEIMEQLQISELQMSEDGMEDMKNEYLDMLKAMIDMLDGARYLWEGSRSENHEESCDR